MKQLLRIAMLLCTLLPAACRSTTASAVPAREEGFGRTQLLDPEQGLLGISFLAEGPAADDARVLAAIEPCADKLIELNLARTAIGVPTLSRVRNLPRLERLDLSQVKLSAGALASLSGQASLRTLILAGTSLSGDDLAVLRELPRLQRVYLHGAGLDASALPRLEGVELLVDAAAPAPLETEPEFKLGSSQPVAANTQCPLTGAPVDASFAITFEGKRIAFCCGKCLASFREDPERYRAKLLN